MRTLLIAVWTVFVLAFRPDDSDV